MQYINPVNIPDWATGLALNLLLAFIIFVILYLLLNKQVRIKTKFFEIANKENRENFYNIYMTSLDIRDKMIDIKKDIRLSEQMTYCSNMIDEIRDKILNSYFNLLSKMNVTDVFNSPIYKSYENIITIMLFKMEKICNKNFIEMLNLFDIEQNVNDDYCYIVTDFEDWKKRVVSTQLNLSSKIIGDLWVDNDILTREESYNGIKNLLPEIANNINSVYQNAILVQLKYSKKIKELAKQLENYKSDILGKNEDKE